jgi:hypothetical protein
MPPSQDKRFAQILAEAPVKVACNPCAVCGKRSYVTVPRVGFDLWMAGAHIQDACPELSVEDRELLISGTCSACFDTLFAEEDE